MTRVASPRRSRAPLQPLKKVRARAPLRLGLAGGGTDLSPFCDQFGGSVLNYTIGVYAYATITERFDGLVEFSADDLEQTEVHPATSKLPTDAGLVLHRAVYNRIARNFNSGRPMSVTVSTAVDAPPGSGLGSSSALVVALVRAFSEFLDLPLGQYDIAHLAFEIERIDSKMLGGRQDQYAAAFGGCNFIEFLPEDRVIVNPLRIHEAHRLELESSLVVCHTGRSRVSSSIIGDQTRGIEAGNSASIEAMHRIKRDAIEMKLALLKGDIGDMARIMSSSWLAKKETSSAVSNERIDYLYELAMSEGALAGKISGAGGGGFFMLLVPPERRQHLVRRLHQEHLPILSCHLTERGVESWSRTHSA